MRAAVMHGREDIKIEEVAEPQAGAGELVLEVHAAGVCGTDAAEFFQGPSMFPIPGPHALTGHTGPMMLSEYGRPIPHLDRVANEFPELTRRQRRRRVVWCVLPVPYRPHEPVRGLLDRRAATSRRTGAIRCGTGGGMSRRRRPGAHG